MTITVFTGQAECSWWSFCLCRLLAPFTYTSLQVTPRDDSHDQDSLWFWPLQIGYHAPWHSPQKHGEPLQRNKVQYFSYYDYLGLIWSNRNLNNMSYLHHLWNMLGWWTQFPLQLPYIRFVITLSWSVNLTL